MTARTGATLLRPPQPPPALGTVPPASLSHHPGSGAQGRAQAVRLAGQQPRLCWCCSDEQECNPQ